MMSSLLPALTTPERRPPCIPSHYSVIFAPAGRIKPKGRKVTHKIEHEETATTENSSSLQLSWGEEQLPRNSSQIALKACSAFTFLWGSSTQRQISLCHSLFFLQQLLLPPPRPALDQARLHSPQPIAHWAGGAAIQQLPTVTKRKRASEAPCRSQRRGSKAGLALQHGAFSQAATRSLNDHCQQPHICSSRPGQGTGAC